MHVSSLSRRLFAMILDWVILSIPVFLGIHAMPVMGGFVVLFFYHPIFESSRLQATIGKHLMGIQVVTFSGERISFRNACLRLVMKILSMFLLFAGHFVALFNEKHKAFHDFVAGTLVVHGRSEVGIADAWIEEIRNLFGAR